MQRRTHGTFSDQYPHIALWTAEYGYVEIGYNESPLGFVRALDVGGVVWDGQERYDTIEAALMDLDAGIAAWLRRQGIGMPPVDRPSGWETTE